MANSRKKKSKKVKVSFFLWLLIVFLAQFLATMVVSLTSYSLILRTIVTIIFLMLILLFSYIIKKHREASIFIYLFSWVIFSAIFPVFEIKYCPYEGKFTVIPYPPFSDIARVNPFIAVFIICVFYVVSIYAIGFAMNAKGVMGKFIEGLTFVGFILVFMMTHEMGHIILFGVIPRAIALVFPMMAYVDVNITEIPLPVLLVGLLGGIMINSIEVKYMCILSRKTQTWTFFSYATILLYIVVVNLLPMPGTDGYYFLVFAVQSIGVLGALLYILFFTFIILYLSQEIKKTQEYFS